ncbi:GDYXXLXY domain-containing protein [Corallococcus sp. M34]|uniref:GDYXXLXY domain-containing protein n=1 Tax=Citreicoccus inhibens TaxID=2849499 RepID=UPI001C23CA4B|nr:GDYXXLXY domain-containing protein [Citreicoccus inhibens]MBU8899287.1 GDYXXLXY domain-containing protein [Citreicoccus inhibens]
MRGPFILGGLALVLGSALVLVAQKEAVVASGQPVLLRLAPVDPRSLMQGDYMQLNYAISADQGWDNEGRPRDGNLVLRLDSDGVGQFVRFDSADVPLAPGEFRLRYRIRDNRVRLGAEAFFFQEGHADRYEHAKYGELRVAESGTSVLVGLRDEDRKPLGDAVH